jgi:uncharacterized protein YabE (DUF348 family)
MGSTMMTSINVQMPSTNKTMSTHQKTKEKAMEECGFAPTKYETLHLLQWMQKHLV